MTAIAKWSRSHATRHPGKTLLVAAGVAIGVATYVAVRSAQQTLADSLDLTVGQLSGPADLRITSDGGVPEVHDLIQSLPEVADAQPVIEQIVQPVHGDLGGVFVVGVDLTAETEMRPIGLDPNGGATVDPLAFLAQPDSIALSPQLASRAGLTVGDAFVVHVGDVSLTLVLRALLSSTVAVSAYGGNVGVMDVYAAQQAFGRGRHFDRIDVRLRPGVNLEAGRAAIEEVAPGIRVEQPTRRDEDMHRQAAGILRAFDLVTVLALALGAALTFNVFAIALERRRRDIAVLRAIGATPHRITWALLGEAAVLGALGGVAGIGLGTGLSSYVFRTIAGGVAVTGAPAVSDAPTVVSTGNLATGIVVGAAVAVLAVWVPAWRAASRTPADLFARGSSDWLAGRTRIPLLTLVVVSMAVVVLASIGIALLRPDLMPAWLFASAVAAVGVTGYGTWFVLWPVRHGLARTAKGSIRLALHALNQPRRVLATGCALTFGAAFVFGTAEYMASVRWSFDDWVARILQADLVVASSAEWTPTVGGLTDGLARTIRETPGVRGVDGVSEGRAVSDGLSLVVYGVESEAYAERTHETILKGRPDAIASLARTGGTVITDDVAARLGLTVGDHLALQTPRGLLEAPITAIHAAFRHVALIDRAVYARYWGPDRVWRHYVTIANDASAVVVRERLRARLGAAPVVISTHAEFVAGFRQTIDPVFRVTHAIVIVVGVMAILGVLLAQVVVAAERARELSIYRALGASPADLRAAVALEAAMLGGASLVLAIPLGTYFGWVLRTRISDAAAGFTFPRVWPTETLVLLALLMPTAALVATWIPTWLAARPAVRAGLIQ